jgi:hypothetical protein
MMLSMPSIKSLPPKESIIKQFILDIPRLSAIIDKKEYTYVDDHSVIIDYLREKTGEENSLIIMHSLTQTFLADYYINKFREILNKDITLHLLDSSNYIAIVDTFTNHVQIKKEFKVMDLFENNSYVIDFCNLDIDIYLNEKTVYYSWSYEFRDELIIIETEEL